MPENRSVEAALRAADEYLRIAHEAIPTESIPYRTGLLNLNEATVGLLLAIDARLSVVCERLAVVVEELRRLQPTERGSE